MNATLTIPGRYNGPPDSGNGGYSCGALAAFVDGVARVRLSAPPPLDRELRVVPGEAGEVSLYDGEQLVGTAVPAALDLDVPAAPAPEEASSAAQGYAGFEGHSLPTCYVCGPQRSAHDGLELYTGATGEGGMVACTWTPAPDTCGDDGNVRAEIVWAALDCPGYFAAVGDRLRAALLGELTVDIHAPLPGATELVVFAWPLGADGRKLYAGSAIADAEGRVLARAKSTWIELRAG